jgi:hypothetical protein
MAILVGDVQPISPEGHYEMAECIIDLARQLGVRRIFTLGGYMGGRYPNGKPKLVGVGDPKILEEFKARGVKIEEGGGPIVGAAGLLIGLGELRGISGTCLLSETFGAMVDHRAAQAVLEVLMDVLGFSVNLDALKQKAEETERMLERIRIEMERREYKRVRKEEEETWYIG